MRTLLSAGVSVTRFGAHKRTDDTLVDWFELIVEEHARVPFDVLHAYFLTQAGFVAAHAGKYLGIPSVVSIRGNDIDRAAFDPGRLSHVMYALQNAGAITTNAGVLVNKAKALIDREIFLIPNGIDNAHFMPLEQNRVLAETIGISTPWTKTHGAPAETYSRLKGGSPSFVNQPDVETSGVPVIGFVGELRDKKGLKILLAAYARVFEQRQAALLIVGGVRQGEDRQFFDKFVEDNPNLQIIVTGYVSPADLPAYYSLIDIFVHPSLRDGMPNAVLEAMSCGKAVIATPVGGIPELIKEGDNGMMIPVGDTDRLVEDILFLLNDPNLRSRLGRAAREFVTTRFPLEKELAGNLDVYRRLGLFP
jgi:glycosyltransferase involved in cell wall biosynthesis